MTTRADNAPGDTPVDVDHGLGVVESVLVLGGKPVDLAAHLERLAGAVRRELRGELPPSLGEELLAACAGAPDPGRLRVCCRPTAQGVTLMTRLEPRGVRADDRQVTLRPLPTVDGLGCVKWADRRRLSGDSIDHQWVVLDAHSTVLETSRCNLLIREAGALITPPLDGRILPGIARAGLLRATARAGLRVAEEPISWSRLVEADEILLTNSLWGVLPGCAGQRGSDDGEWRHLRRLLFDQWRLEALDRQRPAEEPRGSEP